MDLLSLAVPFFIAALLTEIVVDRFRSTGFVRSNDAIASISTGMVFTTSKLFTKLLELTIYAFVLERFSFWRLDSALFDTSLSGLLLWLAVLLLWDFFYYWNHRFGHEFSLLWAAHSVHHQSEEYNLSTALRQTSTGFLFSWVFYLPLFLIGVPVFVVATVAALDLIYQFWVHTRHIGKLGWFDRVFVSPSNHRVHHAQNKRYMDKNYGGILILWDRLFGTFQEELDDEPCIFGVRKPLESLDPVTANLQIYKLLWQDFRRTRNFGDKLRVWISRTGWRPEDCGPRVPLEDKALAGFTKYNPEAAPGLTFYGVAQFVCAIVLTGVLPVFAADLRLASLLSACLWLWLLLIGIGKINEGRDGARRFEFIRLTIVGPLLTVLVFVTADGTAISQRSVLIAFGIYTVLSLLFLWARRSARTALEPETSSGKLLEEIQ